MIESFLRSKISDQICIVWVATFFEKILKRHRFSWPPPSGHLEGNTGRRRDSSASQARPSPFLESVTGDGVVKDPTLSCLFSTLPCVSWRTTTRDDGRRDDEAELIYLCIGKRKSIHLTGWPADRRHASSSFPSMDYSIFFLFSPCLRLASP